VFSFSSDIDDLRKRSRRGAFLSFISLCLLLGSLIYSYYHLKNAEAVLRKTEVEVQNLQAEISRLHADRDVLQDNIAGLQNQRKKLDSEVAEKQREYESLKGNIEQIEYSIEEHESRLTIALGVVDGELYEIQAFADLLERRPRQRYDKHKYRFSLRIWAPVPDSVDKVLSKIQKVDYFFNSETFKYPYMEGNADNGFAVEYEGWGCVPDVQVTIHFKNGSKRLKSFDMCDQLPGIPRK
jgi:cell division protein FtsB